MTEIELWWWLGTVFVAVGAVLILIGWVMPAFKARRPSQPNLDDLCDRQREQLKHQKKHLDKAVRGNAQLAERVEELEERVRQRDLSIHNIIAEKDQMHSLWQEAREGHEIAIKIIEEVSRLDPDLLAKAGKVAAQKH